MSASYLLAIDQGTTSTRVLLFQAQEHQPLMVLAKASREITQYFPQASWVEHDLTDIWGSLQQACREVLTKAQQEISGFHPRKISAIGITNQRETLGVFNRKTSEPLARAIVWQCKRSSEICQRFSAGEQAIITAKTGLPVDPYFSASKITWLLENNPTVAQALRAGSAVVGTIDSYLIHRLSGAQEFVTEASNASRTLLFNSFHGGWDHELLNYFSIPGEEILPRVLDSAGTFALTKGLDFLPDGIPITGVLGDQQAALAGQACFAPGESKCTYGTGAFLLTQLGTQPVRSSAGLLTTVSWSLQGKRSYALEGATYIAGAAVQFIRDQLQLIERSSDASLIPAEISAAPEIYFVPALAGLGAPWWEPAVKGAILGLTRATSKNQLILATLEGIAFQVGDLLSAIAKDFPAGITTLRVDGGACSNDRLMHLQADLATVSIERPRNLESTALGAAIFAALGCGLINHLEAARNYREVEAVFVPPPGEEAIKFRLQKLAGWQRAIAAARMF